MSTAMTPAARQRRRTERLVEQGQVRLSAWVPAATLDALGELARTAGITKRAFLARLIEDAAKGQRALARLKALTRG